MAFQLHPAQLQALRTARRFAGGVRVTEIGNKTPIAYVVRFESVPMQVMQAEISHLCDGEYRELLEGLCNRGYLKQFHRYRRFVGAPFEYQSEGGDTITVRDRNWSLIQVWRTDSSLPGGRKLMHFYTWGRSSKAQKMGKPAKPKRGSLFRPGASFKLEPEGFKLLDEVENASSLKRGNRTGRDRGTQPDRQPGWNRLKIVKSNTGNDLAKLDGKEYRLTGDNDAKFLEILMEKAGAPILAQSLGHECGERSDRIYARLPRAIQRIIDKPGRGTGKKGYRML